MDSEKFLDLTAEGYDGESIVDSEEFVPEIATPQELKVDVIQEEIE